MAFDNIRNSSEDEEASASALRIREGASASESVKSFAWLDLPTEIWLLIIEKLAPSFDLQLAAILEPSFQELCRGAKPLSVHKEDLISLAQTCKRLSHLARQVIFRDVFLTDEQGLIDLCNVVTRFERLQGTSSLVDEDEDAGPWVRALRIPLTGGYPTALCRSDPGGSFYACPVSYLLARCNNLLYLSIMDSEDCHSTFHLLSPGARCQPTHLTVNVVDTGQNDPVVSRPKTYASLSKLTHLHLIDDGCDLQLVSIFLLGNHAAHAPALFRELDPTGPSPHSKLECLRLSVIYLDVLETFGGYVAQRSNRQTRQQAGSMQQTQHLGGSELSNQRLLQCHQKLYDLAAMAGQMPRLRLLILGMGSLIKGMDNPEPYIYHGLVPRRELEQHVGAPQYRKQMLFSPDGRYLPWLKAATRAASSQSTYTGALAHDDRFSWYDGDHYWRRDLQRRESFWQHMESGKHEFERLWRRSQREHDANSSSQGQAALDDRVIETEIRLVSASGALGSAESLDTTQGGAPTDDVGSWADPDVFFLGRTKPWLSYRADLVNACAFWSGELPRKSVEQETGARIEIPPIIDLTLREERRLSTMKAERSWRS
ncbi:uncharacterized protein SRS1_16516 [Sporisorium reilianum f. sp. reilianum]|uniref:F-box domain-containing protein n=1 Tax=Sporisorium reilianum f. sp. reilianum TaxID=72559 RepID=A0A2N8UMJ6_9BASI|nr:uncharacterized protein SRS1_16516 [Sporisorium reilianum f. sp. reilianum]